MSYHHLTISERECILLMHHSKESITQISQVLGATRARSAADSVEMPRETVIVPMEHRIHIQSADWLANLS